MLSILTARPKGVCTPINTPKKNGVQPSTPLRKGVQRLHAFNRRAYGVQPCQTGVQSLHACLEGVQSLHALQTGVQALHACRLTATVYVAPIARLTNPPPSSTTQIRKQLTGHARQTLTRPNHQGQFQRNWPGLAHPLKLRGLREPTGVQSLHACLKGVQALHALQTGVQALHACLAGLHSICTPIEGVQPAGKGVQPLHAFPKRRAAAAHRFF
ncbi:hypothetical protein PCANC_06932 [Puccinia coronata f. sp. avenae]|uniref:Uncharacterized protein n=1 Tax=Puccinia coronata f. sp. avenae TaxID=200324 RepID=A0A2N5VKU2_9BASI|nr:hypothetical protein PCANC_06932 [Puccinia coronata f. sp. avenae]